MVRKKTAQQPKSITLGPDELRRAVVVIERRIKDLEAFDASKIEERWDAKTEALATKINDSLAEIFGRGTAEFKEHWIDTLDTVGMTITFDGQGGPSLEEIRRGYAKGIADAVIRLSSLKDLFVERLEDIVSDEQPRLHGERKKIAPSNRRVFVVHGHDDGLKESAARFLSQLDLDPIILHEQANEGRTIIEKLEANADVGFAVVLLTPDDAGHRADAPDEIRSRARQNVVLELGLFVGLLGRNRVCALYKGDVELPGDLSGVLYVRIDDNAAWRYELAREIKAAGIKIDLNKLA